MILARLTRAFREQNWFAVALEFVIVIAGVVIGFQITAWNAGLQERATERLILCRLQSDFDLIGADVRQHLADAEASHLEAERIVEAAQRGMTVSMLDELDVLQALTLRIPPAGSPTYAQLVSSGDMALIRSEPVRRSLIDFHEELARFQRASGDLSSIVFETGNAIVDVQDLSAEDIRTLAQPIQDEIETRLSSLTFYLNARAISSANLVNVDWKRALVASAERVEAALAPETSHCADRAAP